jgi:hypothetical protein
VTGGDLAEDLVARGDVTAEEVRSARLTVAERAIAGGWEAELGDVLDALGVGGDA